MYKRDISFCRVMDHKGVTVRKELEDCMYEWGINEILMITVDNASFNNIAIDRVKRRQVALSGIGQDKFVGMSLYS